MNDTLFDKIIFDVNVANIEKKEKIFAEFLDTPEENVDAEYRMIYQAVACHNKATEPDDILPEFRKVTVRRPGNREERINTAEKAKQHLAIVYRKSDAVRMNRNGAYIREGNRDKFHARWKRACNKANRAEGNQICRDYTDEDDYDRFLIAGMIMAT